MAGKIVLVATPIGNLGDLSTRANQTLAESDLWLVEDTRVSGKLQSHLGIKKPMRVLNEHTTDAKIVSYLAEIEGKTAAVISDGGTPGISDPGARLVDLATQDDFEIDAIPGPSAVTTALMLSGFYAQRFVFLGFLPRKAGAIKSELEPFVDSTMTLVMFESPFRIGELLKLAGEVLGPRRFAACREMTKLHQEILRGTLESEVEKWNLSTKGEYCLVIEGKRRVRLADNRDVLE
jgi:16S rRNA (cytidine1402-2'-O)-methyltransferase